MPCRIALEVSSVRSNSTVNAEVMRTFSHVFTLKFRFFIEEFIMPVTPSVKIIIGVVVGAVILGGMYALFNGVILPRLNTEIQNMFNYKG